MHTSTSKTGDLRRMDCVHGDALVRVRTVLLQAITTAGNGGWRGDRGLSVLGGGPSHRGCTNMSQGRGQLMSPAASPGDHGHTDTAPWCVSVHKLLPCDSGALRTAETLNPRAWPCALTCAFRRQAAQADPACVSTFPYLELGLKGHLQPATRP